jgi:histidinol-phosphate/aromatic aminotransferase/cobyric acid decarboxylase-like protein
VSFDELGDAFFRVAVRTIAENDRLVTALQSIVFGSAEPSDALDAER